MRRLPAAILLGALLAFGAPAAGQDAGSHAGTFRRAELFERSLGNLEKAKDLYLEAARAAPDATARARAEIRAAGCLRRLDRDDEARGILAPWVRLSEEELPSDVLHALRTELNALGAAEPPPVTAPAPAATGDPKRAEELERELEQARLRLQQLMAQAAGSKKEVEDLAAELRRKDREMERLRASLPPPEPATAQEALELRQQELERQRTEARNLSQAYTQLARILHRDGRFADARKTLYDALEKDPDNTDASALLERVSAPLGDREFLYQRLKETLALAREVRTARRTAEVEYLVTQGRRRQEDGDVAGSVGPLVRALALLDSGEADLREPNRLRDQIERMLQIAEARGIRRPEAPTLPPDRLEARWMAALSAMLEAAGEEVSVGLTLRFHDLDAAVPVASAALPPVPVGAPPARWTLAVERVPVGPLLLAWLEASEPRALAAHGASLDLVGTTVVALADRDAHERLADRIAGLSLGTPPAVELRVDVVRAEPGEWAEHLESRGLESRELAGGARAAEIPAGEVDSLTSSLLDDADPLASGSFRAAHLRAFGLSGGSASASIRLDVLPLSAAGGGAALRVRVAHVPDGRADGAVLSQEALAGGVLARGAALTVFGIADPAEPDADLVTIVRAGRVADPPPPPPALTGGPAGDNAPPAPGPRSRAAQHLLPRTLGGLYEIGPPALDLPEHRVVDRRQALEARLTARAKGATRVEVSDDRVIVIGSDAAHAAVKAMLDRLASAPGVQRFEVRAFEITPKTETSVQSTVPGLADPSDKGFAWAVVTDPKQRRQLEFVVGGSGRPLPMGDPILSAPPTGRDDAAHVVRLPYRRDLDTAPGSDLSWGRAETALVDQGVMLALRPFGVTAAGRADVDVALRLAWMRDPGERTRSTPLGTVTIRQPRMGAFAADLAVELGAGDVLVLAALENPLARGAEHSRLIVLVRALF